MQPIVQGYEPAKLFRFFEELSAIPRPSGSEQAAADYLMEFAAARLLTATRDQWDNVIIKKSGSPGCENLPAVMLQGHTDMVCEQNAGTGHDFLTQGLDLYVEDGFLKARGTTLGADNGLAVAVMLTLLDDKTLRHPPLECVFTVMEEVGLVGAINLDCTPLAAQTMINLDSEEEGIATVSCAGGAQAVLTLEGEFQQYPEPRPGLSIRITGLKGGHSGMDIGWERGNANRLMGRLLAAGEKEIDALAFLEGGAKSNVIARECTAWVVARDPVAAQKAIEAQAAAIAAELEQADPGFQVTIEPLELQQGMAPRQSGAAISALRLIPDGVLSRNMGQGGFVVASSNLGIVTTERGKIRFTVSLRSSQDSLQEDHLEHLRRIAALLGCEMQVGSVYPGWDWAEHSPIRDAFIICYRQQTGEKLRCEAIHAGLECGIFCGKMPGLDAIAVGPNIYDVHTPDERLDLASCGRLYKLLAGVLEGLTQ